MQPLRIRCRPGAFVWYDRWMPFDGILSHAWMLDQFGADFYLLPTLTRVTPDAELIDMQLPLARRGAEPQRYWAASWCDVETATLHVTPSAWVRGAYFRDAGEYYGQDGPVRKKDASIHTEKGPDKLYNVPLHVRVVDELAWYAYGDAGEIRRLLARLPHVGKKCASGWGPLLAYPDGRLWQVEAWPEDWSERGPDGELMRGVPACIDYFEADGVDASRMQVYGYRPPYFVAANQALVEMPA